MFPITLEFSGNRVSTTHPPCYGLMRESEWNSWEMRFHENSWHVRNYKRPDNRIFNQEALTPEKPLGGSIGTACNEGGECFPPGERYGISELVAVWNSGARYPRESYISRTDATPTAYTLSSESETLYYNKALLSRDDSTLDIFNKENGTSITLKEVLTDFEKAIDSGRESILMFKDEGYGEIVGVKTENIPCDRVLFYLMVARELEEFRASEKAATFLHLHYGSGVPIMVAFMASRLLSYENGKGKIRFNGSSDDNCILTSQNLWVGCASRFKTPCAVNWEQDSYSCGSGHVRDDDLGQFYMEPVIEGFPDTSEEFNESMFNAVFGGHIDSSTQILLDQPGGKPVANLVSEFFRAVATPAYYRNRGGNVYCSNWTSDRSLWSTSHADFQIKRGLWLDKLISMLTED